MTGLSDASPPLAPEAERQYVWWTEATGTFCVTTIADRPLAGASSRE